MSSVELTQQSDPIELRREGEERAVEIASSRALAVDRVFKGGSLALFGLGIGLVADFINLQPRLSMVVAIGSAMTFIGVGSVWAGLGARHLLRYGKRGSSLALLSLAGLGGSVVLRMVTGLLLGLGAHPILTGLNIAAVLGSLFFAGSLVLIVLVRLLRSLISGLSSEEPDVE